MTKGWWEKNPPKYTLVLQRVIEEGKKFCSNYITFPKRPFFCISHLNFSRKKPLFKRGDGAFYVCGQIYYVCMYILFLFQSSF